MRQGCPISPYLFLIAAQCLATYISNSDLQGVVVAGRQVIISQLADNTTLFLKNAAQVPRALELINTFSKASGLCLNMSKCELMAIKECDMLSIDGIPVKKQVVYLGITITKDDSARCSLNFDPVIEKTRNKFNMWLRRDLSLRGRCLLSKTEGISRLTYVALSLPVENATAKNIDKLLFNFFVEKQDTLCQKICYNEPY